MALSTIPLVINTIENCYKKICVIGTGDASKALFEYFKSNTHLDVIWKQQDDGQVLLDEDVDIAIFTFPFKEPAQVVGKGNVYSVHYQSLLRNDIENPFWDIYENIIPQLLENDVNVLIVTSPRLQGYQPKIPLFFSMLLFRFINRFSKKHDYYLLKHFDELEIYDEFMNTKADKSKGYVRVFGNGKKINYDDGFRRIPAEKVQIHARKIFLFGFCMSANPMLPDDSTIGACLQKSAAGQYRVLSRGNDGASINLVMREESYNKGDVVVIFSGHRDTHAHLSGADIVDLTDCYCSIKKLWLHIADSSFHCDASITSKVAQKIWSHIDRSKKEKRQSFAGKDEVTLGNFNRKAPMLSMVDPKVSDFVNAVKQEANELGFDCIHGRGDCIVMNCNPFTLGHQWLIETASKQVDFLYIFVVQEDKSYFKFEDRLEMVKMGTIHIPNVAVFSSGSFMISSATLPGYFDKKHLGNIAISASIDLELFVTMAQELGISTRFVGEEPNDGYTNSYNLAMKRLLPRYGIDFVEIPRKRSEYINNVISATYVRNYIEEGKVKEAKHLLPETTIQILEKRNLLK